MKPLILQELYLELTRWCSLECLHCLRGERQPINMNEDIIDNVFKDVYSVQTLFLGGGEPLLAPKVIDMVIDKIKKYGVKVSNINIITNGTVPALNCIKAVKALQEVAEVHVGVSRDSFHLLAMMKNKKLQDTYNSNLSVLKEFLGYDPYDPNDIGLGLDEEEAIIKIGRAANLTPDFLEEMSKRFNKPIYFDSDDYGEITEIMIEKPSFLGENAGKGLEVIGDLGISATGIICPSGLSYEDEDKYPYGEEIHVKDKSLLEALVQYQIMRQASLK